MNYNQRWLAPLHVYLLMTQKTKGRWPLVAIFIDDSNQNHRRVLYHTSNIPLKVSRKPEHLTRRIGNNNTLTVLRKWQPIVFKIAAKHLQGCKASYLTIY